MKPFVSNVIVEYVQEPDGDDESRDLQKLFIEVTQCGGGSYLVVNTKRWAMDKPDELLVLLNEVNSQCSPLFARNEYDPRHGL